MGWKERGLMLIQDVGCVKGSVWMQHATQTPPLPDILLKKKKNPTNKSSLLQQPPGNPQHHTKSEGDSPMHHGFESVDIASYLIYLFFSLPQWMTGFWQTVLF